MKTIVIIQQRLNSTRLPHKALIPLCGKSMTWHIVERCKRAKLVDEVVVATPLDDAEEIGRAVDCQVVAPNVPENDLIGRYYTVAAGMKADFVIRVSGDNSCVEPEEIDYLVDNAPLLEDKLELWMNSEHPKFNHDGFGGELYPIKLLQWMDENIKGKIYREHPHKFWIDLDKYSYLGRCEIFSEGFRLDVNTQADYEKIRDIYEALYPTNPNFSVKDVMEYLNGKNNLAERNFSAGE